MSYLKDKVPCKTCKDLYDPDLLQNDQCRDCRVKESFLADSLHDLGRGLEEAESYVDPFWDPEFGPMY